MSLSVLSCFYLVYDSYYEDQILDYLQYYLHVVGWLHKVVELDVEIWTKNLSCYFEKFLVFKPAERDLLVAIVTTLLLITYKIVFVTIIHSQNFLGYVFKLGMLTLRGLVLFGLYVVLVAIVLKSMEKKEKKTVVKSIELKPLTKQEFLDIRQVVDYGDSKGTLSFHRN
jgi:hypothetical protein